MVDLILVNTCLFELAFMGLLLLSSSSKLNSQIFAFHVTFSFFETTNLAIVVECRPKTFPHSSVHGKGERSTLYRMLLLSLCSSSKSSLLYYGFRNHICCCVLDELDVGSYLFLGPLGGQNKTCQLLIHRYILLI